MTLQIITSDRLASHKHGFFTRHGGVSSGIFKGLNCGAGSSDQSDAVTKNKSMVCDAMGVTLDKLMTVHQIHSADVIISLDVTGLSDPVAIGSTTVILPAPSKVTFLLEAVIELPDEIFKRSVPESDAISV